MTIKMMLGLVFFFTATTASAALLKPIIRTSTVSAYYSEGLPPQGVMTATVLHQTRSLDAFDKTSTAHRQYGPYNLLVTSRQESLIT